MTSWTQWTQHGPMSMSNWGPLPAILGQTCQWFNSKAQGSSAAWTLWCWMMLRQPHSCGDNPCTLSLALDILCFMSIVISSFGCRLFFNWWLTHNWPLTLNWKCMWKQSFTTQYYRILSANFTKPFCPDFCLCCQIWIICFKSSKQNINWPVALHGYWFWCLLILSMNS